MKCIFPSLRTLAAAAALGLAGIHVHAAPVNVTVSAFDFVPGAGYGDDDGENGGTLLEVIFFETFTTKSFSLMNVGDSSTFDVGHVQYQEPSNNGGINGKETDALDVTARLTFSSPSGKLVDVLASGIATPSNGNSATPFLKIDWLDATMEFGDGGLLGISLADLSFTGNPDLPQTLTQSATVTLLSGPTVVTPDADPRPQQVPEPGTLALSAAALAALGIGRRRRT